MKHYILFLIEIIYKITLEETMFLRMRPSLTKPNRDQEILNAHKCRNRLLQLLTSCKCELNTMMKKPECIQLLDMNTKLIYVKCHEFDKYGRLLVHYLKNH